MIFFDFYVIFLLPGSEVVPDPDNDTDPTGSETLPSFEEKNSLQGKIRKF